MHADNSEINVGDTVTVGGQSYKEVGLIAYVNYSSLHEKNTDLIFDALKFDVAMVTESGFDRLSQEIHYTYAWKYKEAPEDEKEEKRLSDDFLKALLTQRDHCLYLCGHDKQYDCKGIADDRYTSRFRIQQRGTDPALPFDAGNRHADRGRHWKYTRIFRVQKRSGIHVL